MGTPTALNSEKCKTEHINIDENSIDAFFANTVIMLTGATGFLGKALLEKLLRSCPRLATIFILIRPKHNQTIEERFKELISNPVFDLVKKSNPLLCNKIIPIKGDVTLPNLGLSNDARNLITQKVNIVLHSAATVKFNEPLKVAVNMNTKGTSRVIDLCKEMKNLISVIYVSTAYSNANRKEIDEMIYPTNIKPSTMIDMCENLDDEILHSIEKKIIQNHPNTYTFTKNLAEQVVFSDAKDLPIAIVRPSIVTAAMKQPYPGWINGFFGITGMALQISRGVIRAITGHPNLSVDIVPIDYVVDTIICATWYNAMYRDNNIQIYNCTNNGSSLKWSKLKHLVENHSIKSPLRSLVWYPNCFFVRNKFTFNIASMFLHFIPAIFIDSVQKILGNKSTMLKSVRQCNRLITVITFFTTHEWIFHRNNMNNLSKKIKSLEDCDNFILGIENIDWEEYVEYYMIGIKKYILNEETGTSSTSQSRLQIFYWINQFTQIMSIIILLAMTLRITF